MICELFVTIAERMAAVHGKPLPKCVLTLGKQDGLGWAVEFNNTDSKQANIEPFAMRLEWCGWPAGIIEPAGGIIAAGSGACEATFRKWLETAN